MSVRRHVSEPQARDCEDTASHHLSNVSDWHYFPSGNEIVGFNGPPGFLTESFSEMLGSYILPESNQVITPTYPSDSAISNEHKVCGTDKHKTKKSMEDYSALVPNSFSIKRAVAEGDVDVLPDVVKTMMVKAEKKERGKVKVSASSSQSLDAKDAQSPARAKRGQATSSHSLAERVRRERISERMKLLQDLVPGCNKITGKAVMLDEIINYVQALQRQVEFLAMKLAAVRPEINVDLEQIIQSQYGNLVIPVYSSGIHISQACSTHRVMQAGMPHSVTPNPDVLLRAASSELSAMNQTHTLSDYDLQHILQLGSMSNQHQESIKIDDTMKVEP